MADPSSQGDPIAPPVGAVGPPTDLSGAAGTARVILDAIQPTIKDVRDEIAAVGKKADRHLLFLLGAFAAGFVLLGGLILQQVSALGDRMDAQQAQMQTSLGEVGAKIDSASSRLDDKIEAVNDQVIATNTQLQDLEKLQQGGRPK